MPHPYSVDLRERVIADCEEGVLKRSEIAAKYRISESTLYLWLERWRADGRLEARPHAGGPASKVDADALVRLVAEKPDRTLEELTGLYAEQNGHRITVSWAARLLKRRGIVRKK